MGLCKIVQAVKSPLKAMFSQTLRRSGRLWNRWIPNCAPQSRHAGSATPICWLGSIRCDGPEGRNYECVVRGLRLVARPHAKRAHHEKPRAFREFWDAGDVDSPKKRRRAWPRKASLA